MLNGQLAIKWAERGRYEEATALLERFKQLPDVPDFIWVQLFRISGMRFRLDLHARYMIEMLEQAGYAERVRRGQGAVIWVIGFAPGLRGMGLAEEAEAFMARLDGLQHRWGEDFFWSNEERERQLYEQASRMTDEQILDLGIYRAEGMATALYKRGEHERAIRLMEAISREGLYASIRTWAPGSKILLAAMYLEAGRGGDAARVLEELSRLLEARVSEGFRNAVTLEQLAVTQAMQRQVDAAISTLELSEASGNARVTLDVDECFDADGYSKGLDLWAALRPDPRFQKLFERCEAERVRQQESIRALLASRDLDVLLAPIMAMAEKAKAKQQAAGAGK